MIIYAFRALLSFTGPANSTYIVCWRAYIVHVCSVALNVIQLKISLNLFPLNFPEQQQSHRPDSTGSDSKRISLPKATKKNTRKNKNHVFYSGEKSNSFTNGWPDVQFEQNPAPNECLSFAMSVWFNWTLLTVEPVDYWLGTLSNNRRSLNHRDCYWKNISMFLFFFFSFFKLFSDGKTTAEH